MKQLAPKLRTVLSVITVSVALLATVVAATLVALTSYLHRTNELLAGSVESVRLAQAAQIDLLLHHRSLDPLVRREIESNMRRRVASAGVFVATVEEDRALKEADAKVADYVAAVHDRMPRRMIDSRLELAYEALEAVVNVNLAQTQAEQKQAARWDRVANLVGVVTGVLVVVVAALLVWWLNTRAFREVFEVARAMQAFGAGDRSARAPEVGAEELRIMARRFNEMAGALATQRDAQIAFLAGVAHDLRNPVSSLRMSVSLIRRNNPLPSEERIRRTLELVERQAVRLERMIGDFLDVAQIDAQKLELHLEQRDAREMVREVVELFAASGGGRPLNLHLAEEELPVRCDPMRIEQVITNLVSNAIKYSADQVEISAVRRDSWVFIEVADRGIGIAPQDRAQLFQPFRRMGLSKETIPGVGLGLFVVREIARAHDGEVEVESEIDVGSTFRVRLPLAIQERPSEESASA